VILAERIQDNAEILRVRLLFGKRNPLQGCSARSAQVSLAMRLAHRPAHSSLPREPFANMRRDLLKMKASPPRPSWEYQIFFFFFFFFFFFLDVSKRCSRARPSLLYVRLPPRLRVLGRYVAASR